MLLVGRDAVAVEIVRFARTLNMEDETTGSAAQRGLDDSQNSSRRL